MMRRVIFIILIAALAAFAWIRLRDHGAARAPEKYTPATSPRIDAKELPGLNALDDEYTRLVQSVVPSVVSVATSRKVKVPLVDSWDYLFGWRGRVTERTDSSLGSGVIVSQEGHILTNHHVINGMEEIQVQLTDGRTLPATLIGSDQSVDIAVLKIQAENLVPLPLGNSDAVKVGQSVIAVGNPFGLQETVTRGILSAKGRSLRDSGVEFFQTDAAVNPGNSGGPLLNVHGEIIGINSAIYSQTGGWAGISFAIPANVARLSLETILKNGRSVRGFLGVNMMALNRALAAQLHLNDLQGALVTEVAPGSPAARAGLRIGDVVRAFNKRPIKDAVALRDAIAQAPIGTSVELELIRDGHPATATAEIVEMPLAVQTAPGAPPNQAPGQPSAPLRTKGNVLAGLVVTAIPENLRQALPQNVAGVIVTQVEPSTPAAEKLRVGDVIEEINKRPVQTVGEFEAVAQALQPGERALIFVCRGRARAFVVVTPP